MIRRRRIVKGRLSATAAATLVLGAAGVAHAEPPGFELMGFPITSLQVSVVGAAHVRERSAAPMLTVADMSASPHQVSVLAPRASMVDRTIAPLLVTAGR